MLVSELKRGEWPNALLSQSTLWGRDIAKLQAIDLDAFIRSYSGTQHYYQAIREVEALIDQGWYATLEKKLEAPSIIFYDPQPRQRITVDELTTWLSATTPVRRRAILFALETGMPIQEIINLTWKKLATLTSLSGYARRIAESNLRHIKLDYVFWENMQDTIAAPLFGLGETMHEVSQGLGYTALRRLYRECLPFDQRGDLEAFMGDFNRMLNEEISK